ncbi:transcription initiation factor TFIID subunit 12b isoform X1 [Lolium rigidum]|uniref:transcription initiation factor TFIID subunit 12b isoform X1 n=1 Tax=Lolium rigidum TaxID=89674 RepID=UPI001F5CBD96|nr:transcription initiation factor TFIID subunit 12b isoform X1 [Lolium rigidum]XP_047059355.1 transcription initiation factor TFIID subunit 12b isoform X1 [Lolium rigidum]XP_047059356.1 transcription initiation factor TFIID subunit 12b isoform X1 [Lolium rigidum]
MADPPSVAAIASPQPDQLGASAAAPQSSNPNPLLSPQIPPSPTVSDLSAISSPQLDPAAAAAGGGPADFPPRPQQLQAPSPTQAVAGAGAGGYGQIHRSGSASRLAAASQLPQYSAAAARMYGGQMSFTGGGGQLGQQQQLAARAAMLGQGQLGMMQGQGNAVSAAHYGLQSQMMSQPRQKGIVQGAQFNTANTAQALQGMQSMGVMGTLGMNQMRPNGTIPYSAQQRFAHAQMRPQQVLQQGALSPQKVAGQGLSRTASIAALNSQLPGASQNGQMMQMSPQQQQQWLKQIQSSMASPVSSHQLQQQQRMILMQQLQKSGLSPHQIAQAQQQHPHLNAQQLMHQQQILQQLQQQQQSPRMPASGSQKSANLTGSQPGTPLSGGTMAGGSGSQGAEGTSQLLGKRKIQDLVAQVDPLGKLDPEVEDLVLEIADDFIESVTAFACSLAKHRKSSVLEAKDVLLHLQKNWHLTVPGFSKEDKNPQRNYVKAAMDPQQLESEAAAVRSASNKQVTNNSIANNQTRGPVAEPSPTPTVGSLSKIPRF